MVILQDSEGWNRALTAAVYIPPEGSNYAKEDVFDGIYTDLVNLNDDLPMCLIDDFNSSLDDNVMNNVNDEMKNQVMDEKWLVKSGIIAEVL